MGVGNKENVTISTGQTMTHTPPERLVPPSEKKKKKKKTAIR